MKKIALVTGVDEKYYSSPIFGTYVNSIINNSNFDYNIITLLDSYPEQNQFKNIRISTVHSYDINILNKNNCIQHGDFLNAPVFSSFSDNDVIIFTDGDMTLQRNLTKDEENFLRNLKDNEVFVGYNASPQDTLEAESNRLGKTSYLSPHLPGEYNNIKVYNTGVLAMNKKTWEKLLELYIKLFPEVDKMFNHYAKQQWLISYIIGTQNFQIYEMPYEFHTHSHYPPPPGILLDKDGILYYNQNVVLFKHKF